ncbi:SDR family NAD(P)-dependent oxidoreductase [Chelatococcus reniformis]|uniref:Short-chain dehydrogenase n=1 Tax=Chelatococcus reniformis TaxID=1494448 RepID=A0A916XA71_9HYPH|nr:SDR family NAD(P)-dependent oxidoreductase [Chelatococcus reniformis]GGC58937.1 short-chain dehydrogenase [Chelatococcus reniformis]
MDIIEGKVAVITGGASGIGLATARSLARQGAKLVLADIEAPALDKAVTELKAAGAEVIGVRADVSNRDSVAALADAAWNHFGAVHIVFNNAGVAVFGPMQDMTHADWDWTMRVNVWGPIHGVEVFVPRLIAQGQGGHVLFTASFAGLISNRDLGPYSVSKAAVVAMAECLAKDVKRHGIGVSVLCPMRVETRIDESFRNRPAELGGSTPIVYPDKESGSLEGRTLPVAGVGDLVVDSIKRNDLYIITHKETETFLERRFDRLKAAMAHAL